MKYDKFLETKKVRFENTGFSIEDDINPILFDYQKDIVKWALRKGKACVFIGTGLGKTFIQLEWAKHVCNHTSGKVLILAPLAVSKQTVEEGKKLNIDIKLCTSQSDIIQGINITNYEKLHNFNPSSFDGIILDESSILKSFTGKTKTNILDKFLLTPYKLACSATPAPNSYMELGSHSEFVGALSGPEMLSMFFIHDGGNTSQWRIKQHAISDFWKWVASWAIMMQNPSDLGYSSLVLPPLRIHNIIVDEPKDEWDLGTTHIIETLTLQERRQVLKDSLDMRVKKSAELANSFDSCLVWCNLNVESEALKNAIPNAYEIKGSDLPDYKSNGMLNFSNGKIKKIISKPSICGFGMNWQHCNKMIFTGLSDSFEQYYQAIRRCWRYGQTKPVDIYIITSMREGTIVENVKRKEKEFESMLKGMIAMTQELTRQEIKNIESNRTPYLTETTEGNNWSLHLGDNIEHIKSILDDSIPFTIYSPPFSSLFTYSDSERDMGNCSSDNEFYTHFKYLADELHRIMMPGRIMAVHCANLPILKSQAGYVGLKDFRGNLIRLFEDSNFIFHSEVCIWKNPVVEMQRTKSIGLLHKQLKKDSTISKQGTPDYLIMFRKKGENPDPVSHTNESFPVSIWQQYASPVWMDIKQSETLQRTCARAEKDEKHICPLQLEVIARAIQLWTNPGDTVFDPFTGIGSSGHVALQLGRKFLGIELKPSYYNAACTNLRTVDGSYNKKLDEWF